MTQISPITEPLTESEYTRLASETLQKVEHALEGIEDGVDFELAAGGILELEFDDGSKIIINKQSAVQEIWVAARSGGYHYRWDGSIWRDTRSGDELFAALSGFVSAQAGRKITL